MADRIGTLEKGKQADLIVIDVHNSHIVPTGDLYSVIVYSAKASDVTDVWVDGKRLLQARRPTTLETAPILEKARSWRRRVEASLAGGK
jgi:5-methylthioadenosine/S-adenosylhomocysteine deaminase